MELGYLCDAVDEWQRRRIQYLEENNMAYADMAWEVEGKILPDCKQVYAGSIFLTTLFETSMASGRREQQGLVVYPLNEKHHVFNMIRVFCHTGLIVFAKGETIVRTIERYAAFHYYGIEQGKHVLKRLISDNLTPSNATMAFEYAVHRDDADLLSDIKTYICNYAFLVFRHKSFFNLRRESMGELVKLCKSDKLNVLEVDLLSNLYRLCEKKVGEKEFPEFNNAFDVLTNKFSSDDLSLWDVVRLTSISMEEFMQFVQKHPGAMTNDDIVRVMQTIYNQDVVEGVGSKKRKKFQTVSSYPRNLDFRAAQNPQADVAHWERDKVQTFFVFDFAKKETVALPSISFGDRHVRCIVTPSDKNIGLRGHVASRSLAEEHNKDEQVFVKFSASIVNFRHDRWKKTSVVVKLTNPCEFEIVNVLSCNAIEGSSGTSTGYVFDVNKYPDYSEHGSWLMMSLSVE
ncbi:unnamed protein product, partial [Sphacelaria rigidula]